MVGAVVALNSIKYSNEQYKDEKNEIDQQDGGSINTDILCLGTGSTYEYR